MSVEINREHYKVTGQQRLPRLIKVAAKQDLT